tara:strand:- start:95 stop:229 length:135 start_codon:yes stop_codon:yes gene_type:complete
MGFGCLFYHLKKLTTLLWGKQGSFNHGTKTPQFETPARNVSLFL